jgi:pimeloyl-ACP methyl ester carboxylesterase
MNSIRLAGMTVDSEGEGAPVIMLHGLGGTSNSFQALLPSLAGFRVIRPDLPGAGRSPTPTPTQKITVEFLVEAVETAAMHLGVNRAHIVGHSFGTLIAQHFAARHPGRVASLTLFGPILEPQDEARERLRARAAMARADGMDAIADQLARAAVSTATANDNPVAVAFVRESHMRQDAEGFARSCEALAQAEKADHRLIGCPTLVVTGDEDAVGPASVAREIADKIGGGNTTILHRCGHWTPIEKSRECAKLLSEFVRKIAT